MATERIFLDQADDALEEAAEELHPNAEDQLRQDIDLAREWLAGQIKARLAPKQGDRKHGNVITELNALNKSGYGLQSVRFRVRATEDDEELLIRQPAIDTVEHNSPTIGFFAPGMIEGPFEVGEVEIPIDRRKGERLINLGRTPLRIRQVSPGCDITLANTPKLLAEGKTIVVWGRQAALRVIMEARPDLIRQRHPNTSASQGSYGCQFLNDSVIVL